jgi:chemotaxis protein methyltransferase CheR
VVESIDVETAALATLALRRDELADIELQLFVDALLRYGGCDFRQFNQAVLRRRVAEAMRAHGVETISALQDRLLHDEQAFASFIVSMRGNGLQLFAVPALFHAFSEHIVPYLRTYPFVRIWVPGSSSGADAYSIAALLADAGILERAVIYATCINEATVAVAKTRIFRHETPDELAAAARRAGLRSRVSDYFEITARFAVPRDAIRDAVMLARHDPVTDGSINEFVAVVARGLLPLYNGAVQYRLHQLFLESLAHLGYLVLGPDESLTGTVHEKAYQRLVPQQPMYRRMR